MQTITKRNGETQTFNINKIITAIESAFKDVDNTITQSATTLANSIATIISQNPSSLSVEQIQDMVEDLLMASHRKDVARAYICYRYKRSILRQENVTDKTLLQMLKGDNEYWKTENSNKNAAVVHVQRDYIAGITSTDLTRRLLLDPKIVKAHDEGIIHFHDADYFAQNVLSNCCLINLEDMLQNGTSINGVHIDKPHRLITASTITTQIITAVSSSQYGGCTISLAHLAPFVEESRKYFRNFYTEFVTNDVEREKLVEESVKKEINDAVQTFNYQVNSMTTTNGQAPFLSVCMYLNEVDEDMKDDLAYIIERFLHQRILGFKNDQGVYVTPAFPKLLYFLEEDNVHPKSKYYYLTRLACKCTAKRMVPDFISEKVMKQLKQGDVYPCMGCVSGKSVIVYKIDGKIYVESFEQAWDRVSKLIAPMEQVPGVQSNTYIDCECAGEQSGEHTCGQTGEHTGKHTCIHKCGQTGEHTCSPHMRTASCSQCSDSTCLHTCTPHVLTVPCLHTYTPSVNRTCIHKCKQCADSACTQHDITIYDTKLKSFVKVRKFIRNTSSNWVYVTISNGYFLTCTDDHPFATQRGRVYAKDLTVNDIVIVRDSADGFDYHEEHIMSIVPFTRTSYSYDVETESDHFEVNMIYSHNCRSFLTVDRTPSNISKAMNYKPHKYYGRFNQGVVTINLADVALTSKTNNIPFTEVLNERLELCHKALRARHDRLAKGVSNIAPIMWQNGALARLDKDESIAPLLYDGYSTISLGYAGLYECVKCMTDESLTTPTGRGYGMYVLKLLNDATNEWKQAENIDYSVYGTPIESTTYKFAKNLKQRFGKDVFVKLDGKDRNYITNSYHIPVFEKINPFEKLAIESEFQALSPGGAISYIECADLTKNIDAVMSVVQFIYDNIMYAELNTKSDYCQVCGYDGEIDIVDEDGKLKWCCPHCGNMDQSRMNVARRTCGYIGTNFFNQGRTNEIADRYVHLDNHDDI